MNFETPSSSIAAAIPANSETTSPTLATISASSANAVTRMLNCSRINAPRPSPVYAPSRAHISCTTTRATVTRTMANSVR